MPEVGSARQGRIEAVREFQRSRIASMGDPRLFMGWTGDRDELIEVMGAVGEPGEFEVFHVMHARQKHIDLVRRKETR